MKVRFFSNERPDEIGAFFTNGVQLDAVPRVGEIVDIDTVGPRRVADVRWILGVKASRREVWVMLEER